MFSNVVRASARRNVENRYPIIAKIRMLLRLAPQQAVRNKFLDFTIDRVSARLSREMIRPDFITYATKHQGEEGVELTRDELNSNAAIMIGAGGETTATQLSGVTFLLLTNPSKMKRLQYELRTLFTSFDDINIERVTNDAPYLIACLNEGLRYYPPVPTGFPRKVPAGGDDVSGYYVPEAVRILDLRHKLRSYYWLTRSK